MKFALAIALLIYPTLTTAQTESQYQDWLCSGRDKETQTGSGTSVDCIFSGYAVEIDWSDNWHQALGQAMFYAQSLSKLPGVILICKAGSAPETCNNHAIRLATTAKYWDVPLAIWTCPSTAREFADCETHPF